MHLKKLHIFKFTKKSDVLPKFWTHTSKIEVSDRISKSLYQQKLRCPGPLVEVQAAQQASHLQALQAQEALPAAD